MIGSVFTLLNLANEVFREMINSVERCETGKLAVIAAYRRRSGVCSCRLSLVANYDLLEGGKQSSQDNPAKVVIS